MAVLLRARGFTARERLRPAAEQACQAVQLGREDLATRALEHKAAALLHSLVRNHALVDGNKRLGWLATAVFLEINGI